MHGWVGCGWGVLLGSTSLLSTQARSQPVPTPPPPRVLPAHPASCRARLDNLVFDSADLSRVLAVLDWELSTLGDPLADLAYNCLPYHLPAVGPCQPHARPHAVAHTAAGEAATMGSRRLLCAGRMPACRHGRCRPSQACSHRACC